MNHSFKNIESSPGTKPLTLFMPGWAFDGRMLRLLDPVPSWIYPENMLAPETIEQDLLYFLETKGLSKVRLVGWSMGAMLALKFAARHSELIDSLVLVSLRTSWPETEIDAIRTEFSQAPASFLKGFYRKCFLGHKQTYTNFRANLEPFYLAEAGKNIARLQRGLDYLSTFKVPEPLPQVPIQLIHGKQDIVAPPEDMPILPGADIEIIDNAGHAPFLHENCSLQHEFRKQAVQQKFSRAADSYDSYAKVQAEVSRRLAAKLPEKTEKNNIKTILEIGCGTGNFTALLAAGFPEAKIVALDFSPEMITIARLKLNRPAIDFICAEGELFLQTAGEKSYDLVVSNGSLQWFSDMDRTLYNIARILVPGGAMSCSIFGPQSLKELGEGLSAIQSLKETLAARTFPGQEELWVALQNNFQESEFAEELIEKDYRSAQDLLMHIKKTGTAGWKHKFQHPLTPSRINQLDEWFIKTYGSCRVTYQIFFLQGRK